MSVIAFYFGIPHGAVWSNIVAEPIVAALTLAVLWPFRNHAMKRFVAFHHKHKTAHAERLKESS